MLFNKWYNNSFVLLGACLCSRVLQAMWLGRVKKECSKARWNDAEERPLQAHVKPKMGLQVAKSTVAATDPDQIQAKMIL